jgi:murein tripeptide amidase MpaA
LWHGTTHAREWISAMTVEYLAYQLIDGYDKDDLITSFLDDYDFYLIPFVNPDGKLFVFRSKPQHTNST